MDILIFQGSKLSWVGLRTIIFKSQTLVLCNPLMNKN